MAEDQTALIDEYFGTSPPLISKRLCKKAVEHNADLTQAEKWLFLSQGNLDGQFLADPQSFTDEQISSVLGRPPPAVLAWNIRTTIGLDSVAEVLRDYWNPNRTDKLSFDAHECVTMGWWTHHTADIYMRPCPKDAYDAVTEAADSLAIKFKPEEWAFEEAVRKRYCTDLERSEAEVKVDIGKEQRAGKSREDWWVIAHEWSDKCAATERDLRKQLRAQVNRELSSATEADLAAIKETRERMIAEVAEETAQEAAEAKAKAVEEEREEKREKEERARKRQLRATEREERKKKRQKNGGDDAESDEDDDDESDSDSDGSDDIIVRDIFTDIEQNPPTREEMAAMDRAEAELELRRHEAETSREGNENDPYL